MSFVATKSWFILTAGAGSATIYHPTIMDIGGNIATTRAQYIQAMQMNATGYAFIAFDRVGSAPAGNGVSGTVAPTATGNPPPFPMSATPGDFDIIIPINSGSQFVDIAIPSGSQYMTVILTAAQAIMINYGDVI